MSCQLQSDKPHWGCCCVCKNRLTLHKESTTEKGYGFVCKLFNDVNSSVRIAFESTEHGVCEGFQSIDLKISVGTL